MKTNFYNREQSLIGIIIIIAIVGLTGGGLYYYLSKQTRDVPKVPEKFSPKEILCQNECPQLDLKKCSDNGYQVCGNYDADDCLEWSSIINCPENSICQNGVCIEIEKIVETVLPKNAKCFWQENRDKPECSQYYKEEKGWKSLACPQYFNPVYDSNGVFYPSACWAEQLGSSVKGYGYSDKFIQFIRDLWHTKGYEVPSPDIEFTYGESGSVGWKSGTWIRSVLWENTSSYVILDFNIDTNQDSPFSTTIAESKTFHPVINYTAKALLVFIMFDEAYPEQILLDWTKTYTNLMNDYIKKKQKVPNPIQYKITPVVISPPPGVEKPSPTHLFFSDEELQSIYSAAAQRAGTKDFEILIVSPVVINGFDGYYTWWNNMELIKASLTPPAAYSATDKKAGLDALAAFQEMFLTISHEVLHALGLPGDHVPMEYGTMYLDWAGAGVDPTTGRGEGIGEIHPAKVTLCDFLGISPDYYAVELPPDLKIKVGNEPPPWSPSSRIESLSGPCLYGLYNNEVLKDYDKDGEYEIMYKNNLIGIELQRALGWVDIDGDGIAELIDPDAYGGWKKK